MAEGGGDEIIDKQICGLCLGTCMKEPKLLSCFHSFCLKCLENYVNENVQDNKFQCPLCNDSIDLPVGGVKNFETNIYIDTEILSKLKHHCDLCGPDVDATHHCIDCNENYCKRCTDTHIRMKVTRTHSLINVDLSDNKRSVTRTLYCEKHPKEELKVICKDCDAMLCLVCKLTDHEKHTSIDISDESKSAVDNMQRNVQKMLENVSKLEDVETRQRDTEQEARKRKQRELEKVKLYEKKLEILQAKRTRNIEEFVNKTFDNIVDEMSSSMKTTKKDILSTRNLALQIERMVEISDKITLIEQSRALSKSFEKHAKKIGFYSKAAPENSLKQCQLSLSGDFLNNLFTPVVMNENVKELSKLSECKESKKCYSLSVFQKSCFAIFGNTLRKADEPFSHFVDIELSNSRYQIGVCVVRGDCYYSGGNEVKVWKQVDRSSKTVAKFEMYPFGIAYRNRDDYEELLVCLNVDSVVLSKGLVKVVPLCSGHFEYDFLPVTNRGPLRIAVNRTNGLVCLSYRYGRKISIHSEDGTLIQTYDCNYMGLSDSFRPADVCFDNDNSIIIVAEGTYDFTRSSFKQVGQVLRVTIFGKVLQVLEKGCCPTSVAVSRDDKLWVGYADKDVTVYKMKNK